MNWWQKIKHHPRIIRLTNWEYWSFNTVYFPIYPIWLFLAARTRSLFFFSAANPTIRNGGFLNESKKEVYALIPQQYYPPTIFVKAGTSTDDVLKSINQRGFRFPLIAKPDVGERGRDVKKLDNERDLLAYVVKAGDDFLIQKFMNYPLEAGIFYHRNPGEPGTISGIVFKEFLTVTGNGSDSIEELLMQNPRYILQLSALREELGEGIHRIPAPGEKLELVPYGNHCRGARFTNVSRRISPQLVETFNSVCMQIPGFHYGRLDVRFESWEKLERGEAFTIIELNGAGSEPTHIYDPGKTIFYAWKEIVRHWFILNRISRLNHRLGVPYMRWKEARQMFREHRERTSAKERGRHQGLPADMFA